MSGSFSRSAFLVAVAACNLLFWIAVAAGVGLAVSREVDLGVETLIREQQATAVQAWQQVFSGALRVTGIPSAAGTPGSGSAGPTPIEIGAVQTSVAASGGNTGPIAGSTGPAQTPVPASPAPTEPPSQPSNPTATPANPVAPMPEATPVSSVLLISDSRFSNLVGMGEEMNRSASGRPVLIRYNEDVLNSELSSLLARNPQLPYRNVQVDLKRDVVLLTADVMLLGFDVGAEVEGTILINDCRPQTEIQSITIARVLTPGFVKEQARAMLVEALDWYPEDYPLCLDQILLEEDRVTIYGHRR